MQNPRLDLKILIILCVFFFSENTYAQLGFCQGNSGDPIFTETFGTGTQDTALPAGTTTYTYANGSDPNDGLYTVSSNTDYFDWFDIPDHTPNDVNGRMLVVNSDFTAGEFYRTTISGLCENTTYEFSSWMINLSPAGGFCGAGVIPINVRFEIWDSTDTNLLASGNTGNITSSVSPNWNQFALVFQSIPGQTSVILKMLNNGTGGCGNDLAIDDIVFKSCGDDIELVDGLGDSSITLCSTQTPFSDTISALPDNSVFSSHFYQWQVSSDGVIWTDIPGETNAGIGIGGITSTTYYRAKVAEFAANLINTDCITFSDVYEIIINEAPVQPTLECWETATFDETLCDWIITGTQPLAPSGLECWETATFNDITCAWDVSGTQPTQPTTECWETATFNVTSCAWEITGTEPVQPNLECWETAVFNDTTCAWEVSGTQPTAPTGLECWETATFNNATCIWEVTGSQPEQPATACWQTATFNNVTCVWELDGIEPEEPTNLECWETATFDTILCSWVVTGTEPVEPTDLECWQSAFFNETSCTWEIIGTQPLEFRDEFLSFCEDTDVMLMATSSIASPEYLWASGEMSESIIVDTAGSYEVEVTDGCLTEIITFNVTEIENPIIDTIVTDGSSITVNLVNNGNYQYSLDGVNYQFSNTFIDVISGLYTIYVKSSECDAIITQEHFHFFIQNYMTPNDDGKNDFFSLNLTQFFSASEVYIFNRYGKLLFSAYNADVNWDGTFDGKELPTSDYWYRIVLDNQEFKGHFTLKR